MNARFIVLARAVIPRLVSQIARAEVVLKSVREWADEERHEAALLWPESAGSNIGAVKQPIAEEIIGTLGKRGDSRKEVCSTFQNPLAARCQVSPAPPCYERRCLNRPPPVMARARV
jgi:hypothetical protein